MRERGASGEYAVAPVRDVGKGASVNVCGRAFQRLDEVGAQRVAEQYGHRLLRSEVTGADFTSVRTVADDDVAESAFEVGEGRGKAEHRHYLACGGDDEAVRAGHSVRASSQPHFHHAQGAVVEVEASAPNHFLYPESVAEFYVIVYERGEQIVGGSYGVEISGEMQVYVFHRDNLCVTAAASAALYAEDGSQRRLSQRETGVHSLPAHTVCKADADRGLAFAERGGVHRRDEHEFGFFVPFRERDLCLVFAVAFQIVCGITELRRDFGHGNGGGVSCDFDITQHIFLLKSAARTTVRTLRERRACGRGMCPRGARIDL